MQPPTLILLFSLLLAPDAPPLLVMVMASSHVAVAISWALPALFNHHGIVISYDILYESDTTSGLAEGVTGTMTTVMGLEEFVQYNVSVRARTSVGPGPFSEPISATTEEYCECWGN